MELDSQLVVGGLIAYAAASVAAVIALLRPFRASARLVSLLMVAGALLLLVVIGIRIAAGGGQYAFGRFETLTLYAVCMTLANLLMSVRRETRVPAGMLAPLVCVVLFVGQPFLAAAGILQGGIYGWWLGIHVVSALVGYALFSLAAVIAAAYLLQDYNLKHKKLGGLFGRLPSLETLDSLMGWQIGSAFSLLTVSIMIGVFLIRRTQNTEWISDPKIILTCITWAVYAVLVHLRAVTGRHGRSLAVISLIGAVCMLFTFVGAQTLAETPHGLVMAVGGNR